MMAILSRTVLLVPGLILTFGCASSGGDESEARLVASTNEDGLVCRFEKETGSHFKKRTCKTRQQLDQERANALSLQRSIQGGSAPDTSAP